MRKHLIEQRKFEVRTQKTSTRPGVLAVVTGTLGAAETSNRYYKPEALQEGFAAEEFQVRLKERNVFGILDHPGDDEGTRVQEISHLITEVNVKRDTVLGTFEVLDTPSGRILHTLLKAETGIGWSLRGYGDTIQEDGREVVTSYQPDTVDIVVDPAVAKTKTERQVELVTEAKHSDAPFAREFLKVCETDGTVSCLRKAAAEKIEQKRRIKSLLNIMTAIDEAAVALDQMEVDEMADKDIQTRLAALRGASDELVKSLKAKEKKTEEDDEEKKDDEAVEDTSADEKKDEAEDNASDEEEKASEEDEKKDDEEKEDEEEQVEEEKEKEILSSLRQKAAELRQQIDQAKASRKTEDEEEEKKDDEQASDEEEKASEEDEKKDDENKKAEDAEAKEEARKAMVARLKARQEERRKADKDKKKADLDAYKVEVLADNILPSSAMKLIKDAESKHEVDTVVEMTKNARFRKERVTRDEVKDAKKDKKPVSPRMKAFTDKLFSEISTSGAEDNE